MSVNPCVIQLTPYIGPWIYNHFQTERILSQTLSKCTGGQVRVRPISVKVLNYKVHVFNTFSIRVTNAKS